jgi:hypothetical protein
MTVIIELQMFEEERPSTSNINPYYKPRKYVRKADREERERTGIGPDGFLDARLIEKPNFEPLFLAARNSHPLDATIRMVEETHVYYVRWFPTKPDISTESISVSKLIEEHFPQFVASSVLPFMKKDENGFHTGVKYVGQKLTDETIQEKWKKDGDLARNTGTMVHFILECCLNGMDMQPFMKFKVIRHFLFWYKTEMLDKGWIPFRTEMRLRSDAGLRLTGTTDAMFVSENQLPPDKCNGTLKIKMVDWKFTPEITTVSKYGKTGYGPCSHLQDCKKAHYGIQQWCYKKMFEFGYGNYQYNGYTYPKVELISMDLLVLHDTLEKADVVPMDNEVDGFGAVVDALFLQRRQLLQEKATKRNS